MTTEQIDPQASHESHWSAFKRDMKVLGGFAVLVAVPTAVAEWGMSTASSTPVTHHHGHHSHDFPAPQPALTAPAEPTPAVLAPVVDPTRY